MGKACMAFATFAIGCGVPLQSVKPPADPSELKKVMKLEEDVVFSSDDTFAPNPQDWLGRIGIVRGNPDCSKPGKLLWQGTLFGQGNGTNDDPNLHYPVNPKDTKAELLSETIVTQKGSAGLSAMNVVSTSLDASSSADVILTSLVKQRVANTKTFDNAVDAFKAAQNALLGDVNVCFVFVVGGYNHMTLVSKTYSTIDAKAKAGYSGINVDGSYQASNKGFTLYHLFELSPTVIKDTTGVSPSGVRAVRSLKASDLPAVQSAVDSFENEKGFQRSHK